MFTSRKNRLIKRGFLKDINPMNSDQQNKFLKYFCDFEKFFDFKISNFTSLLSPIFSFESLSTPISVYIDKLNFKNHTSTLRIIDKNGKSLKIEQNVQNSCNYQVFYTFSSVRRIYNLSLDSYGKVKFNRLVLEQIDQDIYVDIDNSGTIKFHFDDCDFVIKTKSSLIEELRLLKSLGLFEDFSSIEDLSDLRDPEYIKNAYWVFKEIQSITPYSNMEIIGSKNKLISTEIILEDDIIKVFGYTEEYGNETCYHRKQSNETKVNFLNCFERL